MDVGLGRADVGPLLDQPRGQAERQVRRQLRSSSSKLSASAGAGQAAGQGGEQVALLGQRLLQGGKVASACASAACWVATSAPEMAPSPAWPCRMPSVFALGGDDALGRLDLGAQRGLE